VLAAADGIESRPNVGAKLAIVAIFEKTQPFADNFTGRLVHTSMHFLVDQLLKFGGKRYIHNR
jgi:hypothetical protein